MTAPVLVTGATGNVGRHVVTALLDAGVPVRAAVRSGSEVEGAETVRLDFTDPATWSAAFDGVERMFLMRPPQLGRVKRDMIPALEHARRAGVRHMVFLSLQGAQRNRVVPHRAVEDWLKGSGLTWTFVRASFFFQNLATTHAAEIRDTGSVVVPAGRGRTAFVDARDVAAVAAAALLDPAHENVAYTPTGDTALTYGEIASVLSKVLQRPIRYADPSPLAYVRHAARSGMPWGMVAVTLAIYSAARFGLADGLSEDVRRVTGRDPIGVETFARDHAGAWSR